MPPAVAGNGKRATWTGVSDMVAPEVFAVVPVLSVQLAFQLTVASPLVLAVTPTVTEVGAIICSLTVQLAVAPDPSQKPATFAWAASTPAVIPPSASRPVATTKAETTRSLHHQLPLKSLGPHAPLNMTRWHRDWFTPGSLVGCEGRRFIPG